MADGDRLLKLSRARGKLAAATVGTWAAADILHAAHVPAAYPALVAAFAAAAAGWAASSHTPDREQARAHGWQAARWTAAFGGWLTAATALWPAAGPGHAMTLTLGGLTAAGYIRLCGHGLTRQARDWETRRFEWLRKAHRYGLGGSHLLEQEPTRLGETLLINTMGTDRRASQLAGRGSPVAELIAEDRGLPESRVQVSKPGRAGRIRIHIRETDPWADPIPHPLLDAAPEIELAFPATICGPQPVGQDPDTGRPLNLTLYDSHGGKVIAVVAKRDAGKTTLLNCVKERVTACSDAILVQINISGGIEDLEWTPACYKSAVTSRQRGKAIEILDWLCGIVAVRPSLGRDTAVHQPTPDDPAVVCVIDEIGVLMTVPGAADRLKYLASQARKEGVTIVFAGQRAINAWVGGTDVRTQIDYVCIGRVGEQREAQTAAGDLEIPNISAYGEGADGVWLIGEREAGGRYGMGRTFNLSDILDVREIAYERRGRVAALGSALSARLAGGGGGGVAVLTGGSDPESYSPVTTPPPHPPDLKAYDMEHGRLEGALSPEQREQLASIDAKQAESRRLQAENEASLERLRQVPPERINAAAVAAWAEEARTTEIDDATRLKLIKLCAGEGVSGRAVSEQIGEKRWQVTRLLNRLRFEGLMIAPGRGREARWRLTAEGERWLESHSS